MTQRFRVLRTVAALRRAVSGYRAAGETIALVPTMGALHPGHLSLVRVARRRADRVVVSIFVNPAQFSPQEDFATYPRTWAADAAALRQANADLIWAPSTAIMYPEGFATRVAAEGPAAVGLEDAFRPHFFGGVATIVAKLLLQCQPDIAVFGEKDYQQLVVVRQMVSDFDIPTRILSAPTLREKDGLAMSSRNAYLSPAERATAPALYRVLQETAAKISQGQALGRALAAGCRAIAGAGFQLEYLEARHANTLRPIRSQRDGPIRLLVAARLGKTRLIDNIAV